MEVVTNKLKPNSTQINLIARALNADIKSFYDDPANEEAFEEWKSKKEVAKRETETNPNRKG